MSDCICVSHYNNHLRLHNMECQKNPPNTTCNPNRKIAVKDIYQRKSLLQKKSFLCNVSHSFDVSFMWSVLFAKMKTMSEEKTPLHTKVYWRHCQFLFSLHVVTHAASFSLRKKNFFFLSGKSNFFPFSLFTHVFNLRRPLQCRGL